MTCYGSQMVVKNYNVMGVAKAGLEAAVRYIAAELGSKGIRVYANFTGPLATRAASGIPEFDELTEKAQTTAPARSLVSIDDVGAATAFLALDGAKLVTGGVIISTVDITSLIEPYLSRNHIWRLDCRFRQDVHLRRQVDVPSVSRGRRRQRMQHCDSCFGDGGRYKSDAPRG
jgi:hypothetical protein